MNIILIPKIMDDRQLQKMKFSRTNNEKNKEIQSVAADYQDLSAQLQVILSTLLQQKQVMQFKMAGERFAFKEKLSEKDLIIRTLEEENQQLKCEVQSLKYEIDQKRTLAEFLKKKSSKVQLERDSLANIVNYLEQKNREISEEIYELKKSKNLKQRHQNGHKDHNPFFPPYAQHLDRQSLLEYTDFVEKDFLPLDICKTEPCLQEEGIRTKHEQQSQRLTIQKGLHHEEKKGLCNLDRIRSMGQILSSPRENTLKLSKATLGKKRESITKSYVTNLMKQSRIGEKSRRESKQTSAIGSKEISLKRYDST